MLIAAAFLLATGACSVRPALSIAVASWVTAAAALGVGVRLVGQISREAVDHLHDAIASSPIPSMYVSMTGAFLEANDAFVDLVGWSRGELVDMTAFDVGHPDETEHLRASLSALSAATPNTKISTRCVTRTGAETVSDISMSLVRLGGRPAVFAQIEDHTAEMAARSALEHDQLHDRLTGLPNRALLLDRMERSLRSGRRGLVLLVDLDEFRTLNDTIGHDGGDRLLEAVGTRLEAIAEPPATVARLGGDEFAVFTELSATSQPTDMAALVVDSIRRPVRVDGRRQVVTASVGVATGSSDDSASDLVRDAEVAMYRAKTNGRDRFETFDPTMLRRIEERRAAEADLRRGIAAGEMVAHFQPVHDVGSGTLLGFEALARWHHPRRGVLQPDSFIPLAEATGADLHLGDSILEQSISQIARWNAAGLDVSVSVNATARQMADAEFVGTIADLLRRHGVSPSRLGVEITETTMFESADLASVLEQLRALGVELVLDDFGTGYSSLSLVRDHAVDVVKIDRSFILGLEEGGAAIAEAILGLGRALGIAVVGEGVETVDHLNWLRERGCDRSQGYFHGRALGVSDATRYAIDALIECGVRT